MSFQRLCVAWIVSLCVFCNSTDAQQTGLFSGRGAAGSFSKSVTGESEKPSWPKLLDFTKSDKDPALSNPFSGIGPKASKFDIFKIPGPQELSQKRNRLSGFPDLFPKRDPSQPNFLQKMNTRSKDFIDRTTDWAQRKNDDLRQRSSSTWDAITKNLRSGRSKTPLLPTRPPLRAADAVNAQPKVKF